LGTITTEYDLYPTVMSTIHVSPSNQLCVCVQIFLMLCLIQFYVKLLFHS